MTVRLSAQDKIDLIKRAMTGESISKICQDVGISRTIFYKWLRLYKSSSESDITFTFLPKYKRGQEHWHKLSTSLERRIMRLALRNPSWSPIKLSKHLPCSPSFIWTILKRKGFNTISLRQEHFLLHGEKIIGYISPDRKLTLMARYNQGESISVLSKEFRISRTAFYKWLKIYQTSSGTAKSHIFMRSNTLGGNHWRYITEARELVLDIVIEHPDFSVHRIRDEIVRKVGKALISSYTVHIFLKQLGLSTLENRLAYVSSKC